MMTCRMENRLIQDTLQWERINISEFGVDVCLCHCIAVLSNIIIWFLVNFCSVWEAKDIQICSALVVFPFFSEHPCFLLCFETNQLLHVFVCPKYVGEMRKFLIRAPKFPSFMRCIFAYLVKREWWPKKSTGQSLIPRKSMPM